MLTIKIFSDIADPFLKLCWERLELECDAFPQNRYHWCLTWWSHLSQNRTLHAIAAFDTENKAVAIAPFCIERIFGFNILRSFPIQFGDYYSFIIKPGCEEASFAAIFDYLANSHSFNWIRLEQVQRSNPLYAQLTARGFLSKKMTASIIANFEKLSWAQYLSKLHKQFRKNINSRQRKIDNTFRANLCAITNWSLFELEFNKMHTIHEQRWIDDYTPHKSTREKQCWFQAIQGQFISNKMVYYTMYFDEILVAYRLGFIHKSVFYAWHTGYDINYRSYHPGVMMMTYMIRHFIENNINSVNFMAGEYDWKMQWSPDHITDIHYFFSSPSTNVCSRLCNLYHHNLRDRFKLFYHFLMQNPFLRKISRILLSFKKQL